MTEAAEDLTVVHNNISIRNDSSDDEREINHQDIILNCRWVLEGILLPSIGVIGILGRLT